MAFAVKNRKNSISCCVLPSEIILDDPIFFKALARVVKMILVILLVLEMMFFVPTLFKKKKDTCVKPLKRTLRVQRSKAATRQAIAVLCMVTV